MSVKDLFLKLTKTTMPTPNEHLVEQYLPSGYKKDFHGNYYVKVGDSTTMFTSHVDTADDGKPKEVTHVFEGDFIKTDGKTILGADDKAGTAVMLYMIQKNVPGLYYFFLSEERGCVGSRALNKYLETNKDDELYKNITKVIAFDRRDYDSVITYQVQERCCSDEFADELAKRLNEAGSFNYKKDPTGLVTDSHQVATKFAECTNLSVGYDSQHSKKENQNIVFLQRLADACCKINWETLPIKRDPSKTEYLHSEYGGGYSKYSGYSGYGGGEYPRWGKSTKWDDPKWWSSGSKSSTYQSSGFVKPSSKWVTDYLGNTILASDAIWCEYDKAWCHKDDVIWVEYIGFYTTPDYDPSKVKKKETPSTTQNFSNLTIDNLFTGLELYKNNQLFGKINKIDNNIVTIITDKNSRFMIPTDKIISYSFQIESNANKSTTNKSQKLTENDVKVGLNIIHPKFGEGTIIAIRPDNQIARIKFKNPELKNRDEKDIRIDMANMTF